MNQQIFITYRRDDDAGTTGRLFDRLQGHFPDARIFMGVDAIDH